MNAQLKTVLLTILTLSTFVIALVELSGVSKTAILNKWNGENTKTSSTTSSLPKTSISFDETKFDFGKIKEGEKVTHIYHFTNSGKNPLIISDAIASCGCTVPSYPKEPITPGGKGAITVVFNSEGKVGIQRKNVLIKSNADMEAISIGFVVDVLEK